MKGRVRLRTRARHGLAGGASLLAAAVIGGALVGLVEATGLALVAGGPGGPLAWASSAALAAAGAMPLLLALLAIAAAAGRLPLVADWRRAIAAGGPARAVFVWRLLLVAAAAAVMAAVTSELTATTYRDHPGREARLFGSYVGLAATAIGALLAFAVAAVDRLVAPRVRTAGWAARAAGGCTPLLALPALALLSIAVAHAVLDAFIPGLHPAVSAGPASLLVLAVLLRLHRVGWRPRERALAAALLLATAAGLAAVPGAPAGRARVIAHGLASRAGLRALARSPVADRDGDGYPPAWLGGADCDDRDPARHPLAADLAGNRIDENCTGADADPAALASRRRPRPTAAPPARHNILVVSIDAVRADHVGAWGYPRPTTPHLDRLAARATRFAWAFTSTPTTRPAVTSLMTGRHPSTFQWVRRLKLRWKESAGVGLAEVLRAAGWDTAAVACCERFAEADNELAGFATIDRSPVARLAARPGQANSDRVAAAAIDWLRARASDRPFFLWVHFIDPHAPYAVPDGGRRFGDRNVDLYDAEIHFADRSLGVLLAGLDQLGLAGSTIVVVTSDHGEEFEEHGLRYHSRSLYNQVARVPLVLHLPGAAPRVVATPVSIVDLMPTLLDLVGVAGPAGMNGRSLAPAVLGRGALDDRPVLMEVYPQKNIERDLVAVAHGGWKVIWDREVNAWSLFSLDADPGDRDDLAASRPERLAAMKALLLETVDRELSAMPQASRPRARASR